MSEKIYTILYTAETNDHFADKRIAMDVIPFTETISLSSPVIEKRIEQASNESITAVFTSSKAVTAVIRKLAFIPYWKIYCTSGPTRDFVASFFGREAIANTGENASVLAEKMIADHVKNALFFCGNQRRDELPMLLLRQKISLEELIVYETKQTARPLKKDYDAILFFSPAAVKSFFSINKPAEKTKLFALGHTTAAAIREHSSKEIIISDKPDKKALVKMAVDHYSIIHTDEHH